jgi:hypothetical protein
VQVVTGLFIIIGVVMFLLPPVPGVPVYISGGIIVTASAMKVRRHSNCSTATHSLTITATAPPPATKIWNFWLALFYATVVCHLIKLLAIVLQQKGIGEGLGGRVSIRAAVGVNSPTIRAIKLILSEPGVTLPKVCILCGGPDWPTSTLTGILKLSLVDMLLGSMPVYFVIVPCVASGAMILKKADGPEWESAGNLVLTVATMAQSVGLMAAMYFISVQ